MKDVPRVEDLEISQDPQFERQSWRLQRFGWLCMAVVVVGALLGMFGPGPLSSASASASNSFRVDYNRFWRMQSPMTVRVTVEPEAVHDGEAQLWFSQEYLGDLTIEQVTPPPSSVELTDGRVVYHFPTQSTEGPATIQFRIEPETPGCIQGRCGLSGGPEIAFTHYVYP